MITLCNAASGSSFGQQITIPTTEQRAVSYASELKPGKPSVARCLAFFHLLVGLLLSLSHGLNSIEGFAVLLSIPEGIEFLKDWLACIRRRR